MFFRRAFAANENLRFSLADELSGGAGVSPRETLDQSRCKMMKDGTFFEEQEDVFLLESGDQVCSFLIKCSSLWEMNLIADNFCKSLRNHRGQTRIFSFHMIFGLCFRQSLSKIC